MPIDRVKWLKQLDKSNFINSFYQYRDAMKCIGESGSILIIGPGQGLDTLILKWRNFQVITLDIDETFRPDIVGSCHQMSNFNDKQFDLVIASHVLEHLPIKLLDLALSEISRISKFSLIYLPVAGRHLGFNLQLGIRSLEFSVIFDFYRFWSKPDNNNPKYCEGQHFWEIGYQGYKVKDIRTRLNINFQILEEYRNKHWLPSYNFILRSK